MLPLLLLVVVYLSSKSVALDVSLAKVAEYADSHWYMLNVASIQVHDEPDFENAQHAIGTSLKMTVMWPFYSLYWVVKGKKTFTWQSGCSP